MSLVLNVNNPQTALAKKLLSAGALIAVGLASLISPQQAAFAVGRDVGNLTADCDGTDLESQVVVYLELGDTFTIENTDNDSDCMILDPNNILTGEDADHSLWGAGVLEWDDTTAPITIDAAGTFTIHEDDGDTSNIKTFHVKQGFVFRNGEGDIGDNAIVGDSFLYDEVALNGDGSAISATITVTAVSNLNNDDFNVDRNDRPDTDAGIGSGIRKDNADPGYAEYTVAFHAPGNPNSPVVMNDFSATVKDIDSYQWLAVTGASSYLLSSTPATNIVGRTVGSTLFLEELNGVNSETEDENHWAVINFASKSSITLRLGNNEPVSGDAVFNVLFSDVEWETSPTVINLASAPGLADTGVNGAGLNGSLAIAGLLTAVGIATTVIRRRRANI